MNRKKIKIKPATFKIFLLKIITSKRHDGQVFIVVGGGDEVVR